MTGVLAPRVMDWGNDGRISLENLREGVRCHTEMRLEMAAA